MTDPTIPAQPYAFVFPGQGSQFVGMAGPLLDASEMARAMMALADDTLGFGLTELIQNGPAEVLEDTVNAQPAILAVSIAALAALNENAEQAGVTLAPDYVAGHSLGEFTALVAAGIMQFPTALSLVRERGRLMKQAGEDNPGGMAAVLGLDDEAIAEVCRVASADGIVVPANRNCPGQTVISGEVGALEAAMELAKGKGARRVARLNVSIASHSPLMANANAEFQKLLQDAALTLPEFPEKPSGMVIGNTTAQPIYTTGGLYAELDLQMERPVDWTGSMQTIADAGITSFIEIGPGTVLSGLIKRIVPDAQTINMAGLGLGIPTLSSR
ncbi:MAG: ACP S-malonyltransferase [Thermomicrobiales bacterium]